MCGRFALYSSGERIAETLTWTPFSMSGYYTTSR